MKLTKKIVEEQLFKVDCHPDQITVSKGVITVREGFFYTSGRSTKTLVDKVQRAFPTAEIIDKGEVRKAFRGGAPTASFPRRSHWFVKFRVPDKGV